MFLSDSDTAEVIAFRHELHERPELSGEERDTARAVCAFLERTHPDRMIGNLGGHGLAVIYEGAAPGPCLMFRAELDALPIDELSAIPHRSKTLGKAHLCGHDGHMASLAALASGDEACAVMPLKIARKPREAQAAGPVAIAASARGIPGMLCQAKTKSGWIAAKFGSTITASAPAPVSSAGWNSRTTRPRFGRAREKPRASAASDAIWPSWPQRCPLPSVFERCGTADTSSIGSPSSSARNIRQGPGAAPS